MAKLKGSQSKLYDGSAEVPIQDINVDEGMTLVEVSAMGDPGEDYEGVQYNATISFNGFYDPAVPGIANLITKLKAGTPISSSWVQSGTKGSGSAIGTTGTFKLEKFSRKTSKKDMVTFSASGKYSGVLVEASNL